MKFHLPLVVLGATCALAAPINPGNPSALAGLEGRSEAGTHDAPLERRMFGWFKNRFITKEAKKPEKMDEDDWEDAKENAEETMDDLDSGPAKDLLDEAKKNEDNPKWWKKMSKQAKTAWERVLESNSLPSFLEKVSGAVLHGLFKDTGSQYRNDDDQQKGKGKAILTLLYEHKYPALDKLASLISNGLVAGGRAITTKKTS